MRLTFPSVGCIKLIALPNAGFLHQSTGGQDRVKYRIRENSFFLTVFLFYCLKRKKKSEFLRHVPGLFTLPVMETRAGLASGGRLGWGCFLRADASSDSEYLHTVEGIVDAGSGSIMSSSNVKSMSLKA